MDPAATPEKSDSTAVEAPVIDRRRRRHFDARSTVLTLRIPESLAAELHSLAVRSGRTVSEMGFIAVRNLIEGRVNAIAAVAEQVAPVTARLGELERSVGSVVEIVSQVLDSLAVIDRRIDALAAAAKTPKTPWQPS